MFNAKQSKVLFRCLFAYSNGQPVAVFDIEENHVQCGETVTGRANGDVTLKVAVAGVVSESDFGSAEGQEMLATAYEMFVEDPELASDCFQWVRLEAT